MKRQVVGVLLPLLAALAACRNDAPVPEEVGAEAFTGAVPVELVRWFANGGDVLDTLPPDFPPFSLPDSFQVVGSQVRESGEHIILNTGLPPLQAREALVGAFRAEQGWEAMETIPEPVPNVFLPARPGAAAPPRASVAALELCHEQYGVVRIQADYLGEVLSLVHDRPTGPAVPGSHCEREAARRYRPAPMERRYAAWQPELELPDADAGRETGTMTEDELLRGVQLRGEDLSLAGLSGHFAAQMEAQGWAPAGTWSGEFSAGSAWTRRPEGGPPLSAWLDVLRTADASYTLQFGLHAGAAG